MAEPKKPPKGVSAIQAEVAVLAAAIFSLIKSHPRPAMFRSEFEILGEQAVELLGAFAITDDEIAAARKLKKSLLGALPRTGVERE